MRDRRGDLLRDRQRVIDRNGSLGDAVRQRRPLDQLHDEGRRAVALLQTVNGSDVRDDRVVLAARRRPVYFAVAATNPDTGVESESPPPRRGGKPSLPRSRHLPRASTEGRAREKLQ